MDIYKKGESIIFELTLKDEDGTVIDLSGLDTIEVNVYNAATEVTLKTGTYAGGEVTYDDAATGVIQLHIEDGLTSLAEANYYNYCCTVTATDADFDDSTNTSIATGTAFQIINGC